ncbi:endonuclease VII [Streptomyces solincola]|uniref:Endonuclease VII n=1 Tax=Streptomyces solincola TaxID=2100817 RepID=A0A2S9PY45_9ACTN|nr:endonuclease VII domain-containing protein [Streptomyces solincola]PRH79344.1 endonuclease VII [Streptomyces solincola]
MKARRVAAHEKRVQRTYGLDPGEYDRLHAFQGGLCALCRRATGATRKLSVDHDHATGEVRGLLCRPCNNTLGHARDAVAFFARGIDYLNDPPARQMRRQAP